MLHNIEAPVRPDDLFPRVTGVEAEGVGSELILPLGNFSRFVLFEQPELLTRVRGGDLDVSYVSSRQQQLLAEIDSKALNRLENDPQLTRLATLDLGMAISATTFSGGTPHEDVKALNDKLSARSGLPKSMTFEKIITLNSQLPFDQMRTFTDGEIGEAERFFYFGHDLMDRNIHDTTDAVKGSVLALEKGEEGVDEAIEVLDIGAGAMQEFARFMRSYMRMNRDYFSTFRQYLAQYPDGNRNAGGAFIGMPRVDIRLKGLTPQYEVFLDEAMAHFPLTEQDDILQAKEEARNGRFLLEQCRRLTGEPQKKLAQALIRVVEPIRDFRLGHLAAAAHYVPGAFPEGMKDIKSELLRTDEEPILDNENGSQKGTAGFLPGPLLRNNLRLDLRTLRELKEIVGL